MKKNIILLTALFGFMVLSDGYSICKKNKLTGNSGSRIVYYQEYVQLQQITNPQPIANEHKANASDNGKIQIKDNFKNNVINEIEDEYEYGNKIQITGNFKRDLINAIGDITDAEKIYRITKCVCSAYPENEKFNWFLGQLFIRNVSHTKIKDFSSGDSQDFIAAIYMLPPGYTPGYPIEDNGDNKYVKAGPRIPTIYDLDDINIHDKEIEKEINNIIQNKDFFKNDVVNKNEDENTIQITGNFTNDVMNSISDTTNAHEVFVGFCRVFRSGGYEFNNDLKENFEQLFSQYRVNVKFWADSITQTNLIDFVKDCQLESKPNYSDYDNERIRREFQKEVINVISQSKNANDIYNGLCNLMTSGGYTLDNSYKEKFEVLFKQKQVTNIVFANGKSIEDVEQLLQNADVRINPHYSTQ